MLKTFWDKYKYVISTVGGFVCLFFIGFHVEYYVDDEAMNVVSDIAAILGVIAGISIPISLEVINRTADRYQNQRISSFFTEEPLYILNLFSNILCVAVSLSFKMSSVNNLGVILVLYFWFAVNLFLFIGFIYLVQYYITDTDTVTLKHLFKNTSKLLAGDKKNATIGYFDRLKNDLSLYARIGSLQVKEEKSTHKLMEKVSLLLQKALEIKRTNQGFFNKLTLTENEYEDLRSSTTDPFYELSLKLYTKEGEVRLYDTYFAVYEEIWDAAIESKNESAPRLVTKFMLDTLAELSSSDNSEKDNNYIVIDCLLKKICTIFDSSIRKINSDLDSLRIIKKTVGYWYNQIILIKCFKGSFRYQYIPTYNKYFLLTFYILVQGGHKDIFEEQLSSIFSELHIYLDNIICEKKPYSNIWTKAQLENSLSNKENPTSDEDKLKCKWYYYNSLRRNIFIIGAFCVCHNKPEYIRFIWDFFPKDDQVYDLSYFKFNELMNFYLSEDFGFSFGYDGIIKDQKDYVDRYLLLSLARIIKKENLKEIKLEESIKNAFSKEKQEDLRAQLYELEKNQELLDTLEIDSQILKIIHDFLSIGRNNIH